MKNREKRKILDKAKLVQLKYDNNRLRIIEVVEPEGREQRALLKDNPNLIFGIQISGYSKSGLSKSRTESIRRKENTRTFDIDKVLTVREVKSTK